MTRPRSSIVAGFLLFIAVPFCEGGTLLVSVKNPSNISRKSETVELRLGDITKSESSLGSGQITVVEQESGAELASQVEEQHLLFQCDLAPLETKTFVLKPRKPSTKEMVSRVDGYFARPREDYAWENDRIAFRIYGPALAAEVNNGIDVWTKRVRDLIVRKWYDGDAKDGKGKYYHTDRGEGADFFEVGKTLGAGGSGIWYRGTLYQPGVFSSYRTISNGPIRTTFELTYNSWNIEGKKFTETKRISLDAGQNLNRVEVVFSGVVPADSLCIACGLVKRKGVVLDADKNAGVLALWGPTNEDPANGSLGTAVLLPSSALSGLQEDSVQVLLLGQLLQAKPFRYWCGAGWSRSGDFNDAYAWHNYLKEMSVILSQPLVISIRSSGQ